jgi:hypothetical protein
MKPHNLSALQLYWRSTTEPWGTIAKPQPQKVEHMTGLPKSTLIKYIKMKNADKPKDNQLNNTQELLLVGQNK